MIDTQLWVPDILEKLKNTFAARLLYFGLQGSYRRGEATESSDIDLVVLMDTVTLDDLDKYRGLVRAMPEGDKACGFISGAEDFLHWPRHELFPFKMDTADHFGKLDEHLPPITKEDIRENARIGSSALLHLLTHSYLYADADAKPAILKDAYKSAYFTMQVVDYLRSGTYRTSKKELLACLNGTEKEIILAGMNFPAWLAAHSEQHAFNLLREWCRDVIADS